MENIRLSKLFFILLISINSSISYGFDNSDLEKLKATGSCKNCDLTGANLEGAYLDQANLSYSNLNGANLKNVKMANSDLSNTILSGANLTKADMPSTLLDLSLIHI